MAMQKADKATIIEEISGKLEQYPVIYLTNYSGLTVAEANALRTVFRDAGVDFKVYKNTFVKLAMQEKGGFDELIPHLNGPTAVALSDDPSTPARVMKKFLEGKEKKLPELKAAYIDGAVFLGDALEVLTSLKSKSELIGDIVGLLLSPIQTVVGGVTGAGSTLAAIVQTLAEREDQN